MSISKYVFDKGTPFREALGLDFYEKIVAYGFMKHDAYLAEEVDGHG